jgi:hypothetical protein
VLVVEHSVGGLHHPGSQLGRLNLLVQSLQLTSRTNR